MFTFINDINGIVITGVENYPGNTLVIPERLNGLPVKEIGPRAFYGASFSSAVIPAGLETIGEAAFMHAKLKTIVIAGAEDLAKQGISVLSVACIGNSAFEDTLLKHIVFSGEQLSLRKRAFAFCDQLSEVAFNPKMTLVMGKEAFYRNTVTSVAFPNKLFDLPERAFAGCTELYAVQGAARVIGEACFDSCSQLKDIRLPHIEQIRPFAFGFCQSIRRIDIAETTRCIEPGAFALIDNLDYIRVSPDNTEYVSLDGVVFSHNRKKLVVFPCGRRGIYHIPPGVEEIVEEAFSESQLRELTLPPSVEKVHSRALIACLSLRKLTLPDGLTINLEDAIAMVTPGLTVHYQGSKESALANLSGMDAFSDLQVTCLDANGKEVPLFEEDPPKSVHIRWDENGKFVL